MNIGFLSQKSPSFLLLLGGLSPYTIILSIVLKSSPKKKDKPCGKVTETKTILTFLKFFSLKTVSPDVYLSTSGVISKGNLMKYISLIFYCILFYMSIAVFFWNLNSFTFPEKVIVFILISGIQCIAGLISEKGVV